MNEERSTVYRLKSTVGVTAKGYAEVILNISYIRKKSPPKINHGRGPHLTVSTHSVLC